MPGITEKLLDKLTVMGEDIAVIKELVPKIECMYTDMYVGNGYPPIRTVCREFVDNKKAASDVKTEAIKEKKDFTTKVKLQFIGALIGFGFLQFGLIVAALEWIPKLLGK
jgi:hypothetical protein